MFNSLKICLFSKVKGTVLIDGKPVPNATVIREAKLEGDVRTDETKTDKNGQYEFDAMYKMSLRAVLPMATDVWQKIIIRHREKEYLGWDMAKGGIEENGEIGRPLRLICDLKNESIEQEMNNRVILGICRLAD